MGAKESATISSASFTRGAAPVARKKLGKRPIDQPVGRLKRRAGQALAIMDPDPYPTNPMTGDYHSEPAVPPSPPLRATWDDKVDYSRWAFYAGLGGGVLILLAAFLGALLFTAIAAFGGVMPGWAWWGPGADGVRVDSAFPEVPILIALWGLLTGIAVVLCALRIKERPDEAAIPGIVMLVAGLLSFLALGGFLLGGVLAISGGVLAIAGARSLWGMHAPRARDRGYMR